VRWSSITSVLRELVLHPIAPAPMDRNRVHIRSQPNVVIGSSVIAEIRLLLGQCTLGLLEAFLFFRELLLEIAHIRFIRGRRGAPRRRCID
jgi:hypothetical protein